MNKIIVVILVIIVLVFAGYWYFKTPTPPASPAPQIGLTEAQAKSIAEQTCVKGGEALTSDGMYNENSKTWWFDANFNSTQPGCNPACVVSEETKTAEINWRCTGLIVPTEPVGEIIRQLFADKFPKFGDTLSVSIE